MKIPPLLLQKPRRAGSELLYATTHIRCNILAYLDIGKINTVEVIEHLVDLRSVLQHSTSCLSQMIKRCVSSQSLSKGTYSGNLGRERRG